MNAIISITMSSEGRVHFLRTDERLSSQRTSKFSVASSELLGPERSTFRWKGYSLSRSSSPLHRSAAQRRRSYWLQTEEKLHVAFFVNAKHWACKVLQYIHKRTKIRITGMTLTNPSGCQVRTRYLRILTSTPSYRSRSLPELRLYIQVYALRTFFL